MSKQAPQDSGTADKEDTADRKDAADKKDGDDLTTILDTSQRADLTLLIANVTESMRKLLLDNFDASAGLDKSLLGRDEMSEDEKLMSADPATADVERLDRERKLKEEYEKSLATLKMKNLKKNSLKAYDQWREEVILRVGQVVNSERVAKDQLEQESKAQISQPQAPNTIGKITEIPSRNPKLKFKDLFPPTKTPLTKLSMEKRTLVLHSILLLLLSLEHYTAPSRILLLNLTSSLKLPLKKFEQDEYTTAKGLLEAAKEMSADEETKKKAEENKDSRKWKVGIATAAGAAIIGIAGGMAAPLVAAGVGSVMGGLGLGTTAAAGYLGSVAGSTVVVGSLFGAYGGKMTGQMMDNYAREVEDFAFLPVHSRHKTSEDQQEGAQQASDHDHKLRVTICISGWLTEKDEVVRPWRVLGTAAEVFALKYELESLLNLGNAMDGMMKSAAWGYAKKEMIGQTIFADLATAMWPLGLVAAARVIDNPFSVAKGRAEKAGEVLADALINKAQGERPVTLIGYSLGARVIYTCLMSLAKRKAFGLIESVVMIGAPTPSDTSDWRILRSVVSGRLINVFSENDYILGFMYRTSSIQYGVAGLQKVEGLSGVENLDVSETVNGHLKYRYLVGSILKELGFEDVDMDAVEEEHEALVKMEKEEKKQSLRSQRKRLLRRQSTGGKEDEKAEGEHEATEIEKQVQSKTQKSLMTQAIEYFYTPNVPSAKDAEKAAGNAQDLAKDPTKAGAVAGKTADDVQASTESYAQWAAKKLPSMPGMKGRSTGANIQKAAADPTKAAGQVGKTTTDATGSAQSYTQYAAGYLPSLPKSLPSLPSMPSMPSRSKQSSKVADTAKEVTQTGQATAKKATEAGQGAAKTMGEAVSNPTDTAKQAGDAGQNAAKTATGVLGDVVKPTLKNVSEPQNNPAVKAAKDTTKNTPIIHQASDKVATATGTKKEEESYVSKAKSAIPGTKSKKEEQSYVSKASSYLPSMPSIPSFGTSTAKKAGTKDKPATPTRSTSDVKKQPPKLNRVPSGVKSPAPKLDRVPSGVKLPAPKLDRVPSGVKSPAPKLDRVPSDIKSPIPKLDRVPSGIKSPVPKLDRVPSGLKSPAPKLDRVPSGVKSPAPKLDRVPSGVKSPAPKLDRVLSSVKSPAPKLDRVPSGIKSPALPTKLPSTSSDVKSPAPKLDRLPSGLKSPPAKLDRLPSGLKSPPANLERLPSGVKSPPAAAAKQISDGSSRVLKESGNAANKAAGAITGSIPEGVKSPPVAAAKQMSSGAQTVLREGGNVASKTAGALTSKLPFGK